MAKGARKAKRTAEQKKQLRNFLLWSIGITIGVVILMYIIYN